MVSSITYLNCNVALEVVYNNTFIKRDILNLLECYVKKEVDLKDDMYDVYVRGIKDESVLRVNMNLDGVLFLTNNKIIKTMKDARTVLKISVTDKHSITFNYLNNNIEVIMGNVDVFNKSLDDLKIHHIYAIVEYIKIILNTGTLNTVYYNKNLCSFIYDLFTSEEK